MFLWEEEQRKSGSISILDHLLSHLMTVICQGLHAVIKKTLQNFLITSHLRVPRYAGGD